MLAKLTSKNQLTLPKSVTDSLGPVQYFEVQVQAGQVVLTPVRIQRGDAVRAKLAELDLGDEVFAQALAWAADSRSAVDAKGQAAEGKARGARKTSTAAGKAGQGAKLAKAATVATVKAVKTARAAKAAKTVIAAPALKRSKAAQGAVAKSTGKLVKPAVRSTSGVTSKPAGTRAAASKAGRRSAA